jgi:hypothetical protein
MRYFSVLLLLCLSAVAAEKAAYDSDGRIIALLSDAEDVEVVSNVVAVLPSDKRIPLQVRRRKPDYSREGVCRQGNDLAWSGPIELPNGGKGRIELKAEEDTSGVRYTSSVTAESPLEVSTLEFVLDLPRPVFASGRLLPKGSEAVTFAGVKPPDTTFYRGEASALRFEGPGGNVALDLTLEPLRPVTVVDRWDSDGRSFQVRVSLHSGALAAGATATLTAALRLTNKPPAAVAAHLRLDTSKPRYRFDGFGGNYCWDNASPVAAYTLNNLRLAWARTEMKVIQWDQERHNPGAAIRADMETMRRFHQMGVPYVTSIWWLPERFYTDPYEKPRMAPFRRIAGEKWDELLELLGSYLLYAKREYSVEPDLFSFNEANIGIYVGQTPKDHAEIIKRIGAHFRKLGLKTKMLLGDATGPRDTYKFVLEAAADPEAMQYVGAVAFHSWGGGTPEQYTAWGDVSEWLSLPLLVTELGVDAASYFTRSWDSYHYGLREARMTQELLLYARPQGMQFWQFTNDYALARRQPNGNVEPTSRFWLMKHFTDLTPHKSEALATSSDQRLVLFTAFRAGSNHTLHILNLGAAREAVLEGLPEAEWQAVETSETAQYQTRLAGRPEGGALRVNLPSRSLVTLTGQVGQATADQ